MTDVHECLAPGCRRAAVNAAGAQWHDHGGAVEPQGRSAALRCRAGQARPSRPAPACALLAAFLLDGRPCALMLCPAHAHARTHTPHHTTHPVAGSLDGTLIVWDAKAGTQTRQYACHSASVVDCDWRNNTMFASCSQDGSIAVCKLSDGKPLRHWQARGAATQPGSRCAGLPSCWLGWQRRCRPRAAGHTGCPPLCRASRALQGAHSADINSLRWEPNGKLLASCSDDGSVKIWQATSDRPLHMLEGAALRCAGARPARPSALTKAPCAACAPAFRTSGCRLSRAWCLLHLGGWSCRIAPHPAHCVQTATVRCCLSAWRPVPQSAPLPAPLPAPPPPLQGTLAL